MEIFVADLVDYVKECIVKIGETNADVSLRFPVFTLKSLFGDQNMDDAAFDEACENSKASFPYGHISYQKSEHGVLTVTVDKAGVRAISALPKTKKDAFLTALTSLTATPFAGRAEAVALFSSFDPSFRTKSGIEGEFDEAFYFNTFDRFVYCLSYEPDGIHYHRLLKDDFQALYFPLS